MNHERILITGGAGFIGSNLIAKLFQDDVKIHLLLKKSTQLWRISKFVNSTKVSIHFIDLLDKAELISLVAKVGPTIIYHLAAHGASHFQNNPKEIFESNFLSTLNLLDACEPVEYKMFFNIGSSSEYGFSEIPMSEAMKIQPNSYYAIAKSAQTHLACYAALSQKKPIVTIRPFSVFGPLESRTKLFPNLFTSLLNNSPISMGSRDSAHDFVYIDDVIDGLLQVESFTKQSGEIFNFGSGTQITLDQVVETIHKVTKQTLTVRWQKNSMHRWDSAHWVADTSKVKKAINWKPRTFAKGLELYWDWYKQNSSLYDEMI